MRKNKFRLGRNITKLRKQIGLSQTEFGKRLNINQTYVSQIESGNIAPSYYKLIFIIQTLNTTFKILTKGDL